jgi:chemotaxis protein MotB
MKNIIITLFITPLVFLTACVSTKKFQTLDSDYKKLQDNESSCRDQVKKLQATNDDLSRQKADLQGKVDELTNQSIFLKKNNTQVLGALQDMSVLSGKQAESVKQSLENINERDNYINTLQSAIARKDSMNLVLVMNLKGALGNINDQDVNIKVEKGVVYIDISDKMLFNSGRYTVTEPAKIVLGKVAKVLNAYPDIEFMVEGNTDSVPIHTACMDDNWDLSVKRATSVIRILQREYNMKPIRMTAAGRSDYDPVATNSTAEGRSLNRRTRIIILPQLDQFFKLLVQK